MGRPVAAAAINAGVGVGGRFDETDLDDDLRLIALNVTGAVHLAKALVRQMVARGDGKDHVVAGGVINKVQVATTGVLSDELKAKAHRKLTEPGSGS